MTKLILVDQDGVLADFEGRFEQLWQERYPGEFFVTREQRRGWTLDMQYPEHLQGKIWDIFHEPGYFRALKPMPGAIEAMHAMVELGFDVHICTAPMKKHLTCAQEKIEWIAEHLGPAWVERTIIARDKTRVHGDILIDDRPDVHGVVTQPAWKHLLFDCHHNRHLEDRDRVHWGNWREVLGVK